HRPACDPEPRFRTDREGASHAHRGREHRMPGRRDPVDDTATRVGGSKPPASGNTVRATSRAHRPTRPSGSPTLRSDTVAAPLASNETWTLSDGPPTVGRGEVVWAEQAASTSSTIPAPGAASLLIPGCTAMGSARVGRRPRPSGEQPDGEVPGRDGERR